MDRQERFSGCLLGLAAGDALGTTLEFSSPGSFQPVTDMVGGGPFRLKPGEWTDDTSMALCLAASLVERNGFDPRDQMDRYIRWSRGEYMTSNGRCFDIGTTVSAALHLYQKTGDPYAGSTDPYTAGNGSLMRLAPVPMFYAQDPAEAIAKAAGSSRTTHGAPAAVDACKFYAGLIAGALNGAGKAELLTASYCPVPGGWKAQPLDSAIAEVASGSYQHRQPPQIAGKGYVVKSLEAALWAFYRTDTFREGCLMAANLGEDADTTAAIYGQLAGAYYGKTAIPAEWLEKLAMREMIEELAMKLMKK